MSFKACVAFAFFPSVCFFCRCYRRCPLVGFGKKEPGCLGSEFGNPDGKRFGLDRFDGQSVHTRGSQGVHGPAIGIVDFGA